MVNNKEIHEANLKVIYDESSPPLKYKVVGVLYVLPREVVKKQQQWLLNNSNI